MNRGLPALLAALVAALPADAQDQQVGARTKAMGGSYTAFEDDPVSVWLNPAGIATQPDGMSISYQTYPVYELNVNPPTFASEAEYGSVDPPLIPSYLGFVFQLGGSGDAVGICFTTPFRMKFTFFDPFANSNPTFPNPGAGMPAELDQTFFRIRTAYAHDFRFKAPGAEGLLTHLSVGLGADMSVTRWRFDELPDDAGDVPVHFGASDTGIGGGLGVLLGVYDSSSFKVNLGAGYQSKVNYNFSVSPKLVPLIEWPNQVNAGMTFYLLEGLPLRVTLDAQWINWKRAVTIGVVKDFAAASGFELEEFQDSINLSAGVEYRIRVKDGVSLLPRAGIRRYDPPWDDAGNLPFIANSGLIIDTKDDTFIIGSGGLGLNWSAESGHSRSVDVALDFGGDTPGLAFSFTMEL